MSKRTDLVINTLSGAAAAEIARDCTIVSLSVAADGQAPEWVHLFPRGPVITTNDGRTFKLSDIRSLIERSMPNGRPLPIDYDHATDFIAKHGGNAPAAAWMLDLAEREDGLWARVDWTKTGAQRVADKEYRFLSPTFGSDKKTGEIVVLYRAALTNNPALETLKALASRNQGDEDMDPHLKALAVALGLDPEKCQAEDVIKALAKSIGLDPEKAKAEDVAKAAAALKTGVDTAASFRKMVAEALGLDPDKATTKAVETALASRQADNGTGNDPDPSAYVPRAEFDRVREQLNTLSKDTAERSAKEAVDAAIEAGKLAPASRDWGLQLAAKDPESFASFVENAPVVVKPGKSAPNGDAPGKGGELSEADLQVCKQLGIEPETFKKQRDTEEAA